MDHLVGAACSEPIPDGEIGVYRDGDLFHAECYEPPHDPVRDAGRGPHTNGRGMR